MKKRLQPKCQDFKQQLLERAEKQLTEAWHILNDHGEVHSYHAISRSGNGLDYTNCISAYCIIVRWDEERDSLVYHHSNEFWFPITQYMEEIDKLCEAADHLLNRAYDIQKRNTI